MDLKEQIKKTLIKDKEEQIKKAREENSKLVEFDLYMQDSPISENFIKYLNDEGFKYKKIDSKKSLSKVMSIVNMNSLPVIVVNGVYLVFKRDFTSPKQLGGALKFFGNPEYEKPTIEESLLESLKTQNYNLHQRITQLEQKLTPMINVMGELAKDLKAEKESNEKKIK